MKLFISITTLSFVTLFAQVAYTQSVIGKTYGYECYEATLFTREGSRTGEKACTTALRNEALTDSDRSAIYNNRGILRMRSGNYDSAIRDYTTAIQLMPSRGEIYTNYGAALLYQSEYLKAIEHFDMAIKLDSIKLYNAYYNRAMAKERMGDISGAYKDFSKALELLPGWTAAEEQVSRFTVNTPN